MNRTIHAGNSFNPPRPLLHAIRRGWRLQCPNCGAAGLVEGALHLKPCCGACQTDMSPACISGCLQLFMIPAAFAAAMCGVVALETAASLLQLSPPDWLFYATGVILGLAAIAHWTPRAVGAIASLQWALWIGAFDPDLNAREASPFVAPTRQDIGTCVATERLVQGTPRRSPAHS